MASNHPSEAFFRSTSTRNWKAIVLAALLFHGMLALGIFIAQNIRSEKEAELIPVFELVQVQELAETPAPPPPQEKIKEPKPVKKQEVKPQVKPKPKPLPPEPKPEEPTPVEKEPVPEEEPVTEEPVPEEPVTEEVVEETPEESFDIDDMEIPESLEKSSLNPVGSVVMDPVLQAFLERLKQLVMSNFNPPNGLQIPRSAKTTIQFSVSSSGQITDVTLKNSSGNKTWDALSVRAVQITKSPALPPTYQGDVLLLQFNFTPN